LVGEFPQSKSHDNRKAWEDSKVHIIGIIIVDEIVERKRIGMCVFAFGKLPCKYFPKYLRLARELAIKEASGILGRRVKYDILFPSEKTGELPSVGGKIKCSDTELQHVCMADKFMSLDPRTRLDGAIAFVCNDLLAGKPVTYYQSLSLKYGNYSESELRELRKDLWANRSDEYKLKWSEDRKMWWDDQSDEYKLDWSEDKQKWWDDRSDEYKLKWSEDRKKWWEDQSDKYKLKLWDDQSDEYKLKWSEDRKKWWDDQSDEYKLDWSEDKQKWWDDQSDEYKLKWSDDGKRWWDDQSDEYKLEFGANVRKAKHDKRKLSSGSTEEATYYAIDGANEDGTYILITEIFGTNDLNFTKKVRMRNEKWVTTKFHTMETINELHLQKCATQTCISKKKENRRSAINVLVINKSIAQSYTNNCKKM